MRAHVLLHDFAIIGGVLCATLSDATQSLPSGGWG